MSDDGLGNRSEEELPNSPTDFTQEGNETQSNILMKVLIGIAIVGISIAVIGGLYQNDYIALDGLISQHLGTFFDLIDNQENEIFGNEEIAVCQTYIDKVTEIVRKYDGDQDPRNYEKSDRDEVEKQNELWAKNCEPKPEQVMLNLEECTSLYITIQTLISKMEPEDGGFNLDSLPIEEQAEYNQSYREFYDFRCERVVDDIKKTDEFQELIEKDDRLKQKND